MEGKLCVTFNGCDFSSRTWMTLTPHNISKTTIPHPIFSETLFSKPLDGIFRGLLIDGGAILN
jgi:hypothetical protein